MQNLPHTFFGSYGNDFKAEVIAAEMVENGLNPDRILILLSGAMKRTFRPDVTSVEEELSAYDHKEYTVIKTSREGIYDMLPEGLFHDAASQKNAHTQEEIIKSIKQRKQEEINARKFFLPYETTINFLRMQMALYENRLDKRSHYDELINIFSDQWEIFRYLDTRQANIFLLLIPLLHNLRDNLKAVETIFEAIFLLPVSISLRDQLPLQPSQPVMSKLGSSMLGIDLTTGNINHDVIENEIHIIFSCSKNKILQTFMTEVTNKKILELLCDYFLPVHLDIATTFDLDASDKITRLADEESFYNSVLGSDTYL
jgi:hypothetical protein